MFGRALPLSPCPRPVSSHSMSTKHLVTQQSPKRRVLQIPTRQSPESIRALQHFCRPPPVTEIMNNFTETQTRRSYAMFSAEGSASTYSVGLICARMHFDALISRYTARAVAGPKRTRQDCFSPLHHPRQSRDFIYQPSKLKAARLQHPSSRAQLPCQTLRTRRSALQPGLRLCSEINRALQLYGFLAGPEAGIQCSEEGRHGEKEFPPLDLALSYYVFIAD